MREQTKQHLDNILDTLSGGGDDGGVRFIKFQVLLAEMDRRAENGDAEAQRVVDVIFHFSKLINVAQKI